MGSMHSDLAVNRWPWLTAERPRQALVNTGTSLATTRSKQRKETGLAGKRGDFAHLGTSAPAGRPPGTPRHAGMRAKKKGLETIQALDVGGGGRNLVTPITNLLNIKDLPKVKR